MATRNVAARRRGGDIGTKGPVRCSENVEVMLTPQGRDRRHDGIHHLGRGVTPSSIPEVRLTTPPPNSRFPDEAGYRPVGFRRRWNMAVSVQERVGWNERASRSRLQDWPC